MPCSSNILAFYEFYDILKSSIQYHNKNVPSITIVRVLNISPFSTDTRKWLVSSWYEHSQQTRDVAAVGGRHAFAAWLCITGPQGSQAGLSIKHETLTQCWPNVGPLAQHYGTVLDQRLVFAGLQYRREWSGMSGSLLSGSDPGITARRHVWLPCLTTRPCQWSDPRMRVMNIQTSRGWQACWVFLYFLDLMTYTLS